MRSAVRIGFVALAAAFAAGCSAYRWKSAVPADMRTVSVPTFRNESDVTEFGAVVAREVLREFQREGTFRLASPGDAAVEVQGTIRSNAHGTLSSDRFSRRHAREYRVSAEATVSFVDKKSGKVLVNDRKYRAKTSVLVNDDLLTAERDASGRLAEDFARQIVDDVLNVKW